MELTEGDEFRMSVIESTGADATIDDSVQLRIHVPHESVHWRWHWFSLSRSDASGSIHSEDEK